MVNKVSFFLFILISDLLSISLKSFFYLFRSSISHSIRGWGEWFLVEEVKCKSTGCVTETR